MASGSNKWAGYNAAGQPGRKSAAGRRRPARTLGEDAPF